MNIKFRQLKAFSLAASTLSFTEAAERFAVTQASFSNLIKELESDLGVSLFERTTRRCQLTDAGQAFYDDLRGTLDHLESIYAQVSEVGRGRRGRVKLAATPSMMFRYVPKVLARFRRAFPDVELVLNERRRNEEVFDAVRKREAELGLAAIIRAEPGLHAIQMFTDRLVAVVPADSTMAGKTIQWRALAPHPYIRMGGGPADHAMRTLNLQVNVAFDVDHVATAVALVRNGLGLTVLPSMVIPALNLEGVAIAGIAGELAVRSMGVIYRKESKPTRITQAFMKMLVEGAPVSRPAPAPRRRPPHDDGPGA